jgi:flavin-dependent dehydrogenase
MGDLHDVIVIGAGPAGSTAAAFLARRGLDVLLLDKQRFPRDKACGDLIAPSVITILSELGLRGAPRSRQLPR